MLSQGCTGVYHHIMDDLPATSQPREFIYSTAQIASLERTLSIDRLSPYLAASGGDKKAAILLYEWNTTLSEGLYGLLQGLEVALRNAMHEALTAGLGRADWYDCVVLQFPLEEALRKAKRKLGQEGKALSAGRIVAELSFGFWTGLTGPFYAQNLWIPHLRHAFPHKRLGHKTVHGRLDAIRKLRNRVAHHESIISRDLSADLTHILEVVGWICADTAIWLGETNTFQWRVKGYGQRTGTIS